MLLTDGWWGGSTENTSITSARCHKTVKQNQSHIELAGSRCAHSGTHMHPQQAQWNQPVTPASASEHGLRPVMWLSKFCPNYFLNICAERSHLSMHCCNRCCFWCRLFSLSGEFIFWPVNKQPTATILQVFIRARDRRPWCSKTPNCYQCSSSLQQ